MSVILNLPPAVERQLTDRATKVGQSLEEYLQRLAALEAEKPEAKPAIAYPPGFATPEEWVKAFREWAASHAQVSHFVDVSRESIYAGRGE